MCGKDVTRYNEDIDFSDVDTQFVWISVMWIPSSSGFELLSGSLSVHLFVLKIFINKLKKIINIGTLFVTFLVYFILCFVKFFVKCFHTFLCKLR